MCWTLAGTEEGGNTSTRAAPGSSGEAPVELCDVWVSCKHGCLGETADQIVLWCNAGLARKHVELD